jgi:uncharacterized protein YkwD
MVYLSTGASIMSTEAVLVGETSIGEPLLIEPLPSSDEAKTLEAQILNAAWDVFGLTNDARRANGLSELTWHNSLGNAGHAHATDMAQRNILSHTGSDGSSHGDRARRYGYNSSYVGENIAYGYQSAQAVFSGWMNSDGHKKNILNGRYRYCGIGYVVSGNGTPFWCQVFGA